MSGRIKRCLVHVFALLALYVSAQAQEDGWNAVRGKHFLVYYREDKAMAEDTALRAEEYYVTVARDLGFRRYDSFWLWENRVKIFLYGSRSEFVKATQAPEWASGKADYVNREISGFSGSRDFLKSLLPHEIAHLVFRDFLGFRTEAPLWLEEGVAMWFETGRREDVRQFVLKLREEEELFPLESLTGMSVASLNDGRRALAFYAQASSIVGFMISRLGSDAFRKFCGEIRDGKSVDDALRFTYSGTADSIVRLERLWLSEMDKD